MKKYFSLFVSVVIIGVSIHSSFSQSQTCDNPSMARTTLVVHSTEEIKQVINDYIQTNHSSTASSGFGVSVGATIPILDVPIPFTAGGNSSDNQTAIDQVIHKYESETQQSTTHDIYLSFIPKEAFDSYDKCLSYIYSPIEIKVVPNINGKFITIDLSLKQNAQPATIIAANMKLGKRSYNFSQLKNRNILTTPTKITDQRHYSINVEAPNKTSEFNLYIATDRYAPINIYYRHINPSPEKIKPTIAFQCYNPSIRVNVDSNVITAVNLSGRAISEPIQFDINREPEPRVIRVFPNNNGECVATIPQNENFIFTASAIDKSPNGADPSDIESILEISSIAILGNKKEAHFVIKSLNTSKKGNVTLKFRVEYARQ